MASASNTAPANNIDVPRVLVAEDDPAVRSAVVRVLELEGYRVTAVNDGAAALAAITSSPPDAVVMDVMMPFADGLTVC
ncbi:MAG: response regulator transcription factor, partial [Actinomycetota bacterium]